MKPQRGALSTQERWTTFLGALIVGSMLATAMVWMKQPKDAATPDHLSGTGAAARSVGIDAGGKLGVTRIEWATEPAEAGAATKPGEAKPGTATPPGTSGEELDGFRLDLTDSKGQQVVVSTGVVHGANKGALLVDRSGFYVLRVAGNQSWTIDLHRHVE